MVFNHLKFEKSAKKQIMKFKLLAFSVFSVFLSSCSVNYYLCETGEEISTFYVKTSNGEKVITIPKGEKVVVKGRSSYRQVKYNDRVGWAYKPFFRSEENYKYRGSFRTAKRKKKTRTYSNYSSGTVRVKGYYRKDGTYVRPHTRKRRKKH